MKLNTLLLASLLAFFIFLTFGVKAQQGFGTSTPEPSSVIDMTASNKGLLVPRVSLLSLTDAVTVPNSANALTVFNLANAGSNQNKVFPGYYYWNKSTNTWVRLTDNLPYNGLVLDPNNKIGLGGFLDHNSTIFYNNKSISFLTGDEGQPFPGSHSTILDKNGIKLRYNDGGSGIDPSIKDYYLSIENTRTASNTNTQLGTAYDGLSTGVKSIFSYGNFNNEKYIAGQFGSNVSNQIGTSPIQIGVLAKVGYNNVDANDSQTIAGYFQSNNSSSAAVNNYAVYAKATGTKPFAFYADGGAVLIKDLDASATAITTGVRPLAVDASGKLVVTGAISSPGWSLTGNAATSAGANFLGTTDAQDLVFKTNGIENFRINQRGRLIASSTFPVAGAKSLYVGTAGNDTQLPGAVKNTAIGYETMNAITDGSENTALGNQSLNSLKDGIGNTAVGVQALNKAVSTIGNTAIGYNTLMKATGDGNTAVGSESGTNLTSGANNTAIGQATNFASATASNQLNIANNIFGTGLNGSVAAPTGKIGIGTSAPDNTLHVKASANPLKLEGLQTGSAGDKILTVGTDGVVKQQVYSSSLPYVFTTASYVIAPSDYYIIVKPTSSATVDITLPLASAYIGRVISISNFANSSTTVKIKSTSFPQLKTGPVAAFFEVVLTSNNSPASIASGAGKSTWISDGFQWYQIGL